MVSASLFRSKADESATAVVSTAGCSATATANTLWTRRALLTGAVTGAALLAAGCRSLPQDAASSAATASHWDAKARSLLAIHSAVDVHAHPQRFFLKDTPPLDPSLGPLLSSAMPRSLEGMRSGGVAAAVFSTVSDLRSLTLVPPGALLGSRPLAAGEVYADHRRQIRAFKDLVTNGLVRPVLKPADIDAARRSGTPGGLLAAEGSDFLEGRIDRLAEAHGDGLRLIGLMHYRRNEVGDVQTSPAPDGGLTSFGEQVVREMNRLGMIIDFAHASPAALRRAIEISTAPPLVSHVMIAKQGVVHGRLLAAEDALRVSDAGGLIGAWPAGIGLETFDDYIAEILRLVDLLGIDHVAIGTDMDANYQPVFADYAAFPRIPAALLARGMRPNEVVKIIGGNFVRLFGRICGGRSCSQRRPA